MKPWLDQLEGKRAYLVFTLLLAGVVLLAICSTRLFPGNDTFWHLQMGKDWVENGLSPLVDHYSFTYYGSEVLSPPYLFQVSLYGLVKLLGFEHGMALFKMLLGGLTLGLVFVYLKALKSPVIIVCIVLSATIALLELRLIVRPELLSYALSVLAMLLYRAAWKDMSVRNMLLVVALMLFWSNYHTPVLGYVVFFGLFVDLAVKHYLQGAARSRWAAWLGWGLLVVAVGFVNPGFQHSIYTVLMFPEEWKSLIIEYQSARVYAGLGAVYVLAGLSLATLGLALRRKRLGYAVVVLILMVNSATTSRLVTPSGIIILCIFADIIRQFNWQSWLGSLSRPIQYSGAVLAILLVGVNLQTGYVLANGVFSDNRSYPNKFPAEIVEYMRNRELSGRIFNEHDIGGFLIHALSPDSKVYIDGRTGILYPLEHYYQYMRARSSPETLRDEIDKYDIDFVLLENSPEHLDLVHRAGLMGLDYFSSNFLLFRRQDPNLPAFGRMLDQPACWKVADSLLLENEAEKVRAFMSGDATILPFIDLQQDYRSADDKVEFLNALAKNNRRWTDLELRFAAFRALEQHQYMLAFSLFINLPEKRRQDYLAAAHALMADGEYIAAEQVLNDASKGSWTYLSLADVAIMDGLITELRLHKPLELLSEGFVDSLQGQLKDSDFVAAFSAGDTSIFCSL